MPTKLNPPDRHALYELCAQNPARDAALLLAILTQERGPSSKGLVLGEDFSGTAALSRAWCKLSPKHSAVAVDHDRATLAHATPHPRVRLIASDVMTVRAKADLIAVQNFSICELRTRTALVEYLSLARRRLKARGAFICDIYSGSDAFTTGTIRQSIKDPPGLPKGTRLSYLWEQRTADPLSGRVVNAMHFELRPPTSHGGAKSKTIRLHDAFVYDWRLWSVPELVDALHEAGFAQTSIYPRTPDAMDSTGQMHVLPIDDPETVGDSFNVYVVARR